MSNTPQLNMVYGVFAGVLLAIVVFGLGTLFAFVLHHFGVLA